MENDAPTGRNRNGSMFSLSSFLLCTADIRGWRTFRKRLIADTRVFSNGRSKWARCRRRCYPSVDRSWLRRKNACKLTTDVGLFSKNYTFLNRYFWHQDYNSAAIVNGMQNLVVWYCLLHCKFYGMELDQSKKKNLIKMEFGTNFKLRF